MNMIEQEKQIREIEFQKTNNTMDFDRGNQQSSNGYQNYNNNKRAPSRDETSGYTDMSKFQFGNGFNKQYNSSRYNDYDDYETSINDDSNSLTSIQESNKLKNNSQNIRVKKNNNKSSQPEKHKIPNVQLDPLDSQRYNNQHKIFDLQESIGNENSQPGEHRKLSSKNIHLQPLQGVKQLGSNQSLLGLGALNKHMQNQSNIDFEQYANKMPNKVKLDKIQIPR